MTAEREAHLRSLGWLGSFEAREVWAALDEARATAPACEHVWVVVGSELGSFCMRCGVRK